MGHDQTRDLELLESTPGQTLRQGDRPCALGPWGLGKAPVWLCGPEPGPGSGEGLALRTGWLAEPCPAVGHLGHRSYQASSEKDWGTTVHLVAVSRQMGTRPHCELGRGSSAGCLGAGLAWDMAPGPRPAAGAGSLLTGGVVRARLLLPCLEHGQSWVLGSSVGSSVQGHTAWGRQRTWDLSAQEGLVTSCFFCGAGDGTQALAQARQVLSQLHPCSLSPR